MPPHPEDYDFRSEFRRRMLVWRKALLGVTSLAANAAPSGSPPPETPVQTPAGQAAWELSRPRSQFVQPIIIGAFAAAYPTMFVAPFSPPAAAATFVAMMTASVAYAISRKNKQLRRVAGRVLNQAFNLIGLGRLREASEVLSVVESKITEPWALRIVDIQRAIIAIRRGEMAPAEAALTSAIERPIEGFARDNALYQLEGARALRAFVRASLHQAEGAREDIDAVVKSSASDDALARVALAEAMLLEQQGKREELRMLLAQKSALLLEHTHPRERAIVRAFQRMVRSDKSSVYRRAEARREKSEGEEPMLADWVAKVAPGAASFVRSTRAADQASTIEPTQVVGLPSEAAVRANQEAKKPRNPGSLKWIVIGAGGTVATIAAMVGVSEAMRASSAAAQVAAGASGAANVMPLLLIPLIALPLIYLVARMLAWLGRRRAEKKARSTDGKARTVPTDAELRALTESVSPTVAAQASLMLADRAERQADFAAALTAATSGLARLSDPKDRAAADIVYPDLVSLRAFALAATGHFEESNAELASLGPAYPHYSRAVFRATLIAYVRAGDLQRAAAWVEQGEADLPLSVREELLADLVRATVHPEQAGAGEIQRLKDELNTFPEAKAWVRALAPKLLDSFDGATLADVRMRIDGTPSREQEPAPEAQPEHDRQAEDEAAAALELSSSGARFAQ